MNCLWYDSIALDAATFYGRTFDDSPVGAVCRAPGEFRSGKENDVLTIEFTMLGIPCLGLNGGPHFKYTGALSFEVATDDQEETDLLSNAIIDNGGEKATAAGAGTDGVYTAKRSRARWVQPTQTLAAQPRRAHSMR